MPRSLSTVERANPPPRRKSCARCIKAKRRCDLAFPTCLRCAHRGLECTYPAAAAGNRRDVRTAGSVETDSLPSDSELPLAVPPLGPSPQLAEPVHSAVPVVSVPEEVSPFDSSFSMLDYIIDSSDDTLHGLLSLPPHPQSPTLGPTPPPSSLASFKSYSGGADPMANAIATRFQYAIDEIAKAPKTMVLQNQTLWSHAHLYSEYMPRSMQGQLIPKCQASSPEFLFDITTTRCICLLRSLRRKESPQRCSRHVDRRRSRPRTCLVPASYFSP